MSTNELFSFFEEILKDPKKFGSMEEILDEIAASWKRLPLKSGNSFNRSSFRLRRI